MATDNTLYFSPEIGPLMACVKRADLDEANLVQFLVAGHFFSGQTLAKQIRNLTPGEFLVFNNGAIKREHYYSYKVSPDSHFDKREVLQTIQQLLEEAIVGQWQRAKNPGILLSGGIDSRYILLTIAKCVDDTTKLKTICWGENFKKSGSDVEVSMKLSRRLGTQHILVRRHEKNVRSSVKKMFYAQSGMTDSAFIHADELNICKELRERHGIYSLIRGDHSFGGAQERQTIQHGLLDLGMSLTQHITNRDKWFNGNDNGYYDSYSEVLTRLISPFANDPNIMRDTLRFRERIPMYLQYINYFKYHYLEVFNPFLDKILLDISTTIPCRYRSKKRMLKDCYRHRFPEYENVAIAHKDNMINWPKAIVKSPMLFSYLYERIDNLPEIFNKSYFKECLSSINYGSSMRALKWTYNIAKNATKSLPLPKSLVEKLRGEELAISPILLISRLVVLSQWFNAWTIV
jgi:asparagine synthetase B (glutamine-hydrolysing)